MRISRGSRLMGEHRPKGPRLPSANPGRPGRSRHWGWSRSKRELLDAFQGGLGGEDRIGPDECADLELGRVEDEDALEVAEGLPDRLFLRLGDDDERELLPPGADELGSGPGRRLGEGRSVDDGECRAAGVVAQRTTQGGLARLAVDLEREAARLRGEGDASAGPLRSSGRARAGAARSLLAPGLGTPAGDEPAALGRPRAGTSRGALGAHGLVDEVRLHVGAEDLGREGHVLRLLPGAVEERCFRGCHQRLSSRTTTIAFLWPGMAPLTSRRFCSGSRSTTVSPTCVARLLPIWPAIRTPFKTRDGVAEAPIEPGLRMLWEPWLVGPRWKRCRLIVPWKPLPIETPVTLTFSPGSNDSTVTVSPGASSCGPRISTRFRCVPTSCFFRCPSFGLESFPSETSSKASWTASYPSVSAVRTATTGQGPAWMTVTGVSEPVSSSKTCVMPSLRPMIPFNVSVLQLDLDVHARRQVEAHQLVHGLGGRRVDVDQALVRAHLEVLTGVLVLERTAEHRVAVVLGGQGHRSGDGCTGPLRRLDDLRRRPVELLMVVRLQADADLGLSHRVT